MFQIDLHVHTKRYSPCAELLNPDKLVMKAQKFGLDGIVITEHDRLWTFEDIQKLQAQTSDVRFYRGVEISTASGHFVVIGLENLSGIKPGISVEALIQKVKLKGAVLILVHHHLAYTNIASPRAIRDMPKEIDAIEVASSITFGANQVAAENIAIKNGWTAVGGSDAHNLDCVGAAFTNFEILPKDEKHLAQVILSGACKPGRKNM